MTATRVLVVEDDPSVRGLLQTLLSAEGYDVITASDGLAGLVKAASTKPALMLLDLMMPDLGGIYQPDKQKEAQAVYRTTEDKHPGVKQLLGDGHVFLKPFAVAELLARVADVTGGP